MRAWGVCGKCARINAAVAFRHAMVRSLLDHLRRSPVSHEIGEKLPGFEIDAFRAKLRCRRDIRRIHEIRRRPLRTLLLEMPLLRAVIRATKFHLHVGLPPFVFHQHRPKNFSSERGENCTFRTKTPDQSSVIFPDERSDQKIYRDRVSTETEIQFVRRWIFYAAPVCRPT